MIAGFTIFEAASRRPRLVTLCPELDVVSQGKTVEGARRNITEAVELFLETASPSEIKRRMSQETHIAPLAIAV